MKCIYCGREADNNKTSIRYGGSLAHTSCVLVDKEKINIFTQDIEALTPCNVGWMEIQPHNKNDITALLVHKFELMIIQTEVNHGGKKKKASFDEEKNNENIQTLREGIWVFLNTCKKLKIDYLLILNSLIKKNRTDTHFVEKIAFMLLEIKKKALIPFPHRFCQNGNQFISLN